MSGLVATTHALQRMSQRGLSTRDLDLALLLGREVENGLLVLQKDADAFALWLERLAGRVRRLGGIRVVQDGDTLITAYQSTRRKQRRLIRVPIPERTWRS